MVADAERFLSVLLYKHYRKPLFVEFLYDFKHLLHYDRCKAEGRLVKHHQLRACHHASADSKHLLLTAGEKATILLFALLQSGENAVHALNIFLDAALIFSEIASYAEIFIHGELRKDLSCFRDLHKPRLDDLIGLLRCGFSHEFDRSAGGLHDGRDALEQGGFAGAVCTEDRDDLALLNLKRNSAQRLDAAVCRGQIIDFQYCSHQSVPPR